MNLTIRQNTTNMALSQYAGFFFDRGVVLLDGKPIALNCNSLCLLGGALDNGSNVDAEIQTGVTAFGDGEKRARSIHIKGHFGGNQAVEVNYAMDGVTPGLTYGGMSQSRIGDEGGGSLKFQGVRAKHGEYLSLIVKNVSGAKFFITEMYAFLIKGSRR